MKGQSLMIGLLLAVLLLPGSGSRTAAVAAIPSPPPLIDLSGLSDDQVYAEFLRLALDVEAITGKSLAIRGRYQAHVMAQGDETAHWLVLEDEDGCCAVGLTLALAADSSLNYPEDGSRVELLGLVESYVVGDQAYPLLRVSQIKLLP